jgi:secreted trypsin-like serine protease
MGISSTNRIYGGRQTGPNQFPWMVQLLIRVPDFFRYQVFRCGASLIKDRYLLTAAHCVYYTKLAAVALIGYHFVDPQRLDVINVTGLEQRINVTRAFIPLDFDPPTMTSDIAVLELEHPVQFNERVHTICLPSSDYPDTQLERNHSQVTVAGWGYMPYQGQALI